ncbi:MAG: NUDIX hydrolase, partial [Myxococcota bacterium]|nr:NUDIX hydrolase [Myxococcota bacterium]
PKGEDLLSTAKRVLQQKAGISPKDVYLEQLYTFGRANRDPRGRVVSVAHYALLRPELVIHLFDDQPGATVKWFATTALPHLAFDHDEIVNTALTRLRGKVDYSAISLELVPELFSIRELRTVFSLLTGKTVDPGNFRRKFQRMLQDRWLEEVPEKQQTPTRPAKLYRSLLPPI